MSLLALKTLRTRSFWDDDRDDIVLGPETTFRQRFDALRADVRRFNDERLDRMCTDLQARITALEATIAALTQVKP